MKQYFKRLSLGLAILAGLSLLISCGESVPTASPVIPGSPAVGSPALASTTSAPQTTGRVAVGAVAPDFTAKDTAGGSVQLSTMRGKAVLINYWAVY